MHVIKLAWSFWNSNAENACVHWKTKRLNSEDTQPEKRD
jgi:hypothetical protein